MGSFFTGRTTREFIDPLELSGFEWMRPAVSSELKLMKPRAERMQTEIGEAVAPSRARFTDIMERGAFRTPEEEEAIGYARGLLGTGAERYMGGYDPEVQRRAIVESFGEAAPEAVSKVLTQAGLGAPGIHHGLVREEAKTVAEDLYTQMLQQLAEENRYAAEFGRGAEQLAAQQRALGMTTLPQIAGFTDLMQREQTAQQYLQQLIESPEQAYMRYISPMLEFDPQRYAMIQKEKRTPGWGEILGSVFSSMGSMGGGGGGGQGGGGGGCCWNFLAAEGYIDPVVRRYRDENLTPRLKRGYYKLAEIFVPLMKKHRWFKQLVRYAMTQPMTHYGRYYYNKKQNWLSRLVAKTTSGLVTRFWLRLYDFLGQDHPYIREMGELI